MMLRVTQPPQSVIVEFPDEDGTTSLRLRYDANALLMLEHLLGLRTLAELGERFDAKKAPVSMGNVIKLIYAGAKRYQPEITEHEVGQLIDITNMERVLMAAVELLGGQAPDQEVEEARNQEVRVAEHPLSETTSQDSSFGPSLDTTWDSPEMSLENSPLESLPS